ncbi:hypothetical protein SBM3_00007 [Synechococcus phage S-BM3]|nr:hypothetical protein SBM3_00007 [Synechococcus phage S-BM3]
MGRKSSGSGHPPNWSIMNPESPRSSPKNAKWASTTKSITSSVAEQLYCSQNQSTAISADAIVSNMKSCRSCRVWGFWSVVFFMCTQYTILGAMGRMVDTLPTDPRRPSQFVLRTHAEISVSLSSISSG